ncbi:MAG: AIR synthase-related protein, partial [Methylocystis sp.]|nr:AIR synthase-related protein [Methylocystis sp.]
AYGREICGRDDGAPPPVDLSAEKRNGEFVRELVLAGRVVAAHDVSDGGLALALAEMALAGNVGADVVVAPDGPPHAILFGEDQARYIVAASDSDAPTILKNADLKGVPISALGVTRGRDLILPGEAPISLEELRMAYETPLPAYMAGDDSTFG